MNNSSYSSLEELRQFLAPGTRPDVQLAALKVILSLSANTDFLDKLSADADLLLLLTRDLCRLFTASPRNIKSLILAIFINFSGQNPSVAAKLVQSDPLVGECFELAMTTSPTDHSVPSAQLLCNFSRLLPDQLHDQLHSLDSHFLNRLFEFLTHAPSQTSNKLVEVESAETFIGFLLMNLSTIRPTNCSIVSSHLSSLTSLLGQSVPLNRRLAALNILYNVSMVDELHELLLRDEDELLSSLLWPLVDAGDQLDEEEVDRLPIQLQYWEGRRDPGTVEQVRDKVLRTLYQLCATRRGRECLRRKGIYALLRELDKAMTTTTMGGGGGRVEEGRICTFVGTEEGTDRHFDVLRALIGVLIRTEAEMGSEAEGISIRQLGSTPG